jgi:chromosome partitioning protein
MSLLWSPKKGGSGTKQAGGRNCDRVDGERVAIVEADPQGTLSKWKERCGHPYRRFVRVADPAEREGALVSLEAQRVPRS